MMNDPIAHALSALLNAVRAGKTVCVMKPSSSLLKNILSLLQDHRYIGTFKEVEDGRGNRLEVNLIGSINQCGAIKPRSPLTLQEYDKFEKRYLPARAFGILIISTSRGLRTHTQAKEEKLGGRLIAYCY